MNDATQPAVLSERDLTRSSLDYPVVGIGASAGGLRPLLDFFAAMPADSGMAFVVVVHLSPKHVSTLPLLIQETTAMRVLCPQEPVSVEANTVYVIPPNKMLSMNDGYLRVTELDRPRGRHVAIDLFFRTLATVHRERAFAVLLSGTGSDGAVGITRIKEEGGISIVQNPNEAEFDGMPRAAVATGTIDWVLPITDIPGKLVELWRNMPNIELPIPPDDDAAPAIMPSNNGVVRFTEESLRDILAFVRARTGHDFQNYKRATVLRRLERRLQVHGLPNLSAYRALLHAQPEEANALLKDLLIGVTNFFRDGDAFDVLQREVISKLAQEPSGAGLRAWVAGCSTGEEAYSLAVMMCEETAGLAQPPKVHIFATDIDEAAIAQARMGTFPTSIETDVSPARLRRFFDHETDLYRVRKEVREKVMFAVHNLLHDPPFSRLDFISCRNLLIYLDREVHNEILEMFHFALRPGGYLFLGSSESADTAQQYFSVVDKKNRIYRANLVPRSARYMPSVLTSGAGGTGYRPLPPAPEKRTGSGYAELHRRLAEEYAPPSVLVDPDSNIVHLSERAGRYLQHSAGEPSHNLMALVRPELRLELRTAVFQATRSGKSVEARRVRIRDDGRDRYVNMIARPVREPESGARPLVLVLFDEVEDTMSSDLGVQDGKERDPLLVQLEDELSRTKEQLQNTIEHSDTSTEELKASNEELQAINEELRSTTEELETSKEELQSINEELITVNHELKTKIEETGKINDDLQNLIASTDIATVFVDRTMSIKRYTPHATRLFNLIPGDVGRSLLDITHKLDYDRLADDATEAFQSLRVIEREVSTESGKWYLARVLPYRTTEDRIDGAVLTFVDITGRHMAEETTRLIAESTRDFAIITSSLEGRIETWNLGAEKIFGFSEADAVGMPVSAIFVPEDRESGVVEREMARARNEGRAEDDRWHLRRDGLRVFCSGITSPLLKDGKLIGYSKIARDLTGSKRLEAQREALLREEAARRMEAQNVVEMKDEFFAMVSHELKNPLNLIQLNADLLMRLPEAKPLPSVQRAAGIIRKTVVSQAQIIDDLLDLTRLNTGKMTLHVSVVDLAATVESIAGVMREEAGAKGVRLSVEAAHDVIHVEADPVRVEQIVWNLLVNSVKFTPAQGRVDVRIALDGPDARLEVRDSGRGIEPHLLPSIFDLYRQGDPITRAQPGLGVGLAVVRQLVDLHGGRIEAHSGGRDQGSCFRVWLPLAGGSEAQASESSTPHHLLSGKRVLVVDDDAMSAQTLRSLLETEGMHVIAANEASEALALVAHEVVDVVITDVAMPGMDGRQLLDHLRRDARLSRLPVVAMTGLVRPGDERWLLEAGFDAHLDKPIALERLLGMLESVLRREA